MLASVKELFTPKRKWDLKYLIMTASDSLVL